MYANLSNELRRKNINQAAVAAMLKCDVRTFTNKINGTSDFTVTESLKIHSGLLPEFEFDYLFTREDKPA